MREEFLGAIRWGSNGKVRASWGLSGNAGVGAFVAHQSLASEYTSG